MSAQLTEKDTLPVVDGNVTEHPNLAAAFVAAQAEMPAVEKDATNPHFKSSFTSLGKLIATVRPVLNRHGLAVAQLPSQDQNGRPTLVTKLVHTSGEVMEETMPLIMAKQDAQALGSSITYAKRYALSAALSIADQEDDDGNAAISTAPSVQLANQDQMATLNNALTWFVGAGADEQIRGRIEEICTSGISSDVARSVVQVIQGFKDLQGQGPDQGTGAGAGEDTSPAESSSVPAENAPSPDQAPAEGVESEIPADTEGLD